MAGRQRELRKARRRPKRQAAWISPKEGDALIPCVIWDLSEDGARLRAAHCKNLPDFVYMLMSKDGASRRLCRVVWRSDKYIGVQFVQAHDNDDWSPANPGRWRAAVVVPDGGRAMPGDLICASHLLALPSPHSRLGGSNKAARKFAPSGLTFGFVFLLVAATAVFYVAGLEIENGTAWALQLCDTAKNLCDHPEMSGVPAVLLAVVCFALKGMEL